MRVSVFLAALLVASASRAADKTYFGASAEVLVGGGVEGLTVAAAGLQTVVGRRLSRFFALEGFFTGLVDAQPYREPGGGAECSGEITDRFHWETFGLRLWIRAVHSAHVDFWIAPPGIAAGAMFTHERPIEPLFGACQQLVKPRDVSNALVVVEIFGLALELRQDPHFGWRFTVGGELEFPFALSVTASAGPVVHF